jgi:light-regulated signal transduction histidine kinase (bacteriophytochrome)
LVDLTDCDREPIHIPGMIQPYGVLLALSEPDLIVAQVSENVGDHLPLGIEDILDQPLSSIIDPVSVDELREALREGSDSTGSSTAMRGRRSSNLSRIQSLQNRCRCTTRSGRR